MERGILLEEGKGFAAAEEVLVAEGVVGMLAAGSVDFGERVARLYKVSSLFCRWKARKANRRNLTQGSQNRGKIGLFGHGVDFLLFQE